MVAALISGLVLCALAQAAWWWQFRGGPGMPTESRLHLTGVCLRSGAALAALAAVRGLLPPAAAQVFAVLLALAWAGFETVNLTALKYFNLPALSVRRHLPLQSTKASGLSDMLAAARSYVPLPLLSGLWLGSSLALALAVQEPVGAAADVGLAALAALGLGAGLHVLRRPATRLEPRLAEAAFLGLDDKIEASRIARTPQPEAVRRCAGRQAQARHMLLIINESAGDDVPAGVGDGVSLADRICAVGAGACEWVRPANAVTPSSCTDITLPCLLTGAGPQGGYRRFAQLPSIFDMARLRDMRTLFYSAGSLQWANLETFLDFHAQDDILSPQLGQLPFVNDLGCDDYLVAQRLHERILATDEALCIVVYLHGLHLPFQKDSACGIPNTITDRRRRAAHVAEASHALIFDALRQSGRFDDTLIVSVGDHGEAFSVDPADRSSRQSRLSMLSATVTRPLFVIKPPRGLEPACSARLQANAGQLLSLIDVAPTVASVLGVELLPGLQHAGYDLCRQAVPADRIHYTLNVNDWRSWPQAAVMLAQGTHRVCIDYQSRDLLCCDGRGQPLPEPLWPQTSRLLAAALHEPLVQKSITRVFRDKLDRAAAPRSAAAADPMLAAVPARLRAAPGRYEAGFGADFQPTDAPSGRLHAAEGCRDACGLQLSRGRRGILVYGPYIDLPPGRYRASFLFAPGAAGGPLDIDVLSQESPRIAGVRIQQLDADQVASVGFELQQPATALEVRLHSHGAFSGRCLGLHLADHTPTQPP